MEAEILINKHDEQIDRLNNEIHELSVEVKVLVTQHGHLSQKVDKILDLLKKWEEIPFRISANERRIQELEEKYKQSEKQLLDSLAKIKEIEVKTNKWNNFFSILRQHWPLIVTAITVLACAIDFIYRHKYNL